MTNTPFTLVVTKPRLPDNMRLQSKRLKQELVNIEPEHSIWFLPVFELSDKPESHPALLKFAESSLEKRKLIVFVSPSALEFGMAALGGVWPQGVACGLMGAQSASLALELGVPDAAILAPRFRDDTLSEDSEGLYELVKSNFAVDSLSILICKGPRGRSHFYKKLKAEGYSLEVLETYDRKAIEQNQDDLKKLLNLGSKALIWVTSSECISTLDEQLCNESATGTHLLQQNCECLTTHPRIESRCKELGYINVHRIPTGVSEVKNWISKRTKDGSTDNPKQQDQHMSNQELSSTTTAEAKAPMTTSSSNPTRPPKQSNLGPVLGGVALVCVLALAFLGQQQLEQAKQVMGERLQEEKTRVKMMQEQLSSTEGIYRDLKARFDLMEATQQEAASQRASLEAVYKELVANRSAVSLSEIEQLISMAKRQIFVLGNVGGAKVAISQAIELLAGSDNPSMISLRTNLEKDLAELNAVKEVDSLTLAIELDSVIDSVDILPTLAGVDASREMTLAELSHGGPGKERIDPVQHNPNLFQSVVSGIGSLVITVWEDVKSLVEITRVDNPEVLQLSSQQQTDLRNTLRLALLNARLSLLSRHASLLQSDISRSQAILSTYFDQNNVQVKRALDVLGKVGSVQLNLALPDLQNSTASLNMARMAEGEGN